MTNKDYKKKAEFEVEEVFKGPPKEYELPKTPEFIRKMDDINPLIESIEQLNPENFYAIKVASDIFLEDLHRIQATLQKQKVKALILSSEITVDDMPIEELADLEHEQWRHWMKFMLTEYLEPDVFLQVKGSVTQQLFVIPALKVQNWLKLCNTPYKDLTEEEKEKDREWARKVIKVLVQNI